MKRKLYAERPGWGKDFDYDEARHLVAYAYARELVRRKDVMDAGCGEGFATQTLTETAHSVVGVDYHAEAVETARHKWSHPKLSFRVIDLASAPADDTFDVVLNFQVLEHVPDDAAFVRKLHGWLRPGGTLMLTTPNVLQSFSENPCHLREYRAEQLEALLRPVFAEVKLLGVFGNERVREFDRNRLEHRGDGLGRRDGGGLTHGSPPGGVTRTGRFFVARPRTRLLRMTGTIRGFLGRRPGRRSWNDGCGHS